MWYTREQEHVARVEKVGHILHADVAAVRVHEQDHVPEHWNRKIKLKVKPSSRKSRPYTFGQKSRSINLLYKPSTPFLWVVECSRRSVGAISDGRMGKYWRGAGKTLLCAGCRRKDDQGNNFLGHEIAFYGGEILPWSILLKCLLNQYGNTLCWSERRWRDFCRKKSRIWSWDAMVKPYTASVLNFMSHYKEEPTWAEPS